MFPRNFMHQSFVFLLLIASLPSIAQVPFVRSKSERQIGAFPLHTSSSGHYLLDRRHYPFPILGRTAWCVISQPEEQCQFFIRQCKRYGFNAIEMNAINHDPRGNHVPYNGKGDLPFLKTLGGSDWRGSLVYGDLSNEAPDFNTPNDKYWDFVDAFLKECESIGVLVFLFPAYVGYSNTDQGWMREMTANGPLKMEAYGRWIATRFRNRKNIVWMLLGDMGVFNEAQKSVEAALIRGLKSVPHQRSTNYSAEGDSGQNSTDQVDFGKEMTLNGTYTWDSVGIAPLGRRAYSAQPAMPSFLLEEPYDQEGPDGNGVNPHATQPVRRFQWWGWLSTIGGYIAGNGYVWPFVDPLWREHSYSVGVADMSVLNGFIQTITWWELVPSGLSGMRTLVLSGIGSESGTDYVAAAATPTGSLLVAYVPPAHNGDITLDISGMTHEVEVSWLDPGSGTYTKFNPSSSVNTGSITVGIPGTNSRGAKDWVLVIHSVKDPE